MAKKYIITKKSLNGNDTIDNMINGVDNASTLLKAADNIGNRHDDDEELNMFLVISALAPDVMAAEENKEFVMSQMKKIIYLVSEIAKEIVSPAVMKEWRKEFNGIIEEEKTE